MTTISFSASGGKYVGTFTATGDFNLHIASGGGLVTVWQKISGATHYSKIAETDTVFDADITGEVWSKNIKIECEKQPLEAGYTLA